MCTVVLPPCGKLIAIKFIISYHIISSYHITSHHITSHYITSHHITSHHITPHHITSHHVTSRHVTSVHVTSRQVTSHHITSRHIISYHISYVIYHISYHISHDIILYISYHIISHISKWYCVSKYVRRFKVFYLTRTKKMQHVGCSWQTVLFCNAKQNRVYSFFQKQFSANKLFLWFLIISSVFCSHQLIQAKIADINRLIFTPFKCIHILTYTKRQP
jgi:hypothetical protein